MKVDIHSSFINQFSTPFFYNSLLKFAERFSKIEPKAKCLQLYSDFYTEDSTYSYLDDEWIYYPLTVIYYKRDEWETVWVYWSRQTVGTQLQFSPFSVLEEVEINICNSVPQAFTDSIKGKEFVYYKNKQYAEPCIAIESNLAMENRGKFSQKFADVLAFQISKRLVEELGCENLNSKWSIEILLRDKTHRIDGKNYRRVELKNSIAHVIHLGVCWEGTYDVSDYVTDDNIVFNLTEEKFEEPTSSFEQIKTFVKNKGLDITIQMMLQEQYKNRQSKKESDKNNN